LGHKNTEANKIVDDGSHWIGVAENTDWNHDAIFEFIDHKSLRDEGILDARCGLSMGFGTKLSIV